MSETDLKHIIEATLLAAGRPVPAQQLLDLFDERERPTPELLKAALELLAADYAERGIELVEVASGWRIQVRPRVADTVSRLWQERPSRYSRALLETLALVAYRQPITRSEIEEIRGVSISSTIMRTLQERNWIRIVGHREVPGRPELLGTTREFLDYFGLKSLDQLPTLAELKDVETIGVQLELPAGDAAQDAASDDSASGEPTSEEISASDEASEESETQDATAADAATPDPDSDSERLADGSGDDDDADGDDEDGDASPTMVASDEDAADERRSIGEPPREE